MVVCNRPPAGNERPKKTCHVGDEQHRVSRRDRSRIVAGNCLIAISKYPPEYLIRVPGDQPNRENFNVM